MIYQSWVPNAAAYCELEHSWFLALGTVWVTKHSQLKGPLSSTFWPFNHISCSSSVNEMWKYLCRTVLTENDTTESQELDIGLAWSLSVLMELVFVAQLVCLGVSETLHHDFSVHWAAMTSFPLLWPPWPNGMLDTPLPDQDGYCRKAATENKQLSLMFDSWLNRVWHTKHCIYSRYC